MKGVITMNNEFTTEVINDTIEAVTEDVQNDVIVAVVEKNNAGKALAGLGIGAIVLGGLIFAWNMKIGPAIEVKTGKKLYLGKSKLSPSTDEIDQIIDDTCEHVSDDEEEN